MGDPACYRETCPECDCQVTIVTERCPSCGRDLSVESGQESN
jgi:uncharacterized protein YbbK (DUF523 family)